MRTRRPPGPENLPLFDAAKSVARRDHGMATAASAAGAMFQQACDEVIQYLADARAEFFADDFWEIMEKRYPHYAVMDASGRLIYGDASGAAFKRAYRNNVIRKTGRSAKSRRPRANAKNMPIVTGSFSSHPCPHCKGTGVA